MCEHFNFFIYFSSYYSLIIISVSIVIQHDLFTIFYFFFFFCSGWSHSFSSFTYAGKKHSLFSSFSVRRQAVLCVHKKCRLLRLVRCSHHVYVTKFRINENDQNEIIYGNDPLSSSCVRCGVVVFFFYFFLNLFRTPFIYELWNNARRNSDGSRNVCVTCMCFNASRTKIMSFYQRILRRAFFLFLLLVRFTLVTTSEMDDHNANEKKKYRD